MQKRHKRREEELYGGEPQRGEVEVEECDAGTKVGGGWEVL